MPAKAHELAQVALIRATRVRVVDVGEPGDRQRHLGQLLELDGREVARWDGLGCSQGAASKSIEEYLYQNLDMSFKADRDSAARQRMVRRSTRGPRRVTFDSRCRNTPAGASQAVRLFVIRDTLL